MLALTEPEVFTGPNTWSERPVLTCRVEIDIHAIPDRSALRELASQVDAIVSSLPPSSVFTIETNPATLPPGSTSDIATLLASLILVLQQRAGWRVEQTGYRPGSTPGRFELYCEHEHELAGIGAVRLAADVLTDVLQGRPPAPNLADRWQDQVAHAYEGASAPFDLVRLITHAKRRGIPVRQPIPRQHLIEFGSGRHQHRFWRLTTSETSRIAERLSGNKALCYEVLRQRGLPVPNSLQVRTVAEAVAAAESIGYPIVLKPVDSNHARGVFLELTSQDQIRQWFAQSKAASRSGRVLVETFLPGASHRILVIGYEIDSDFERIHAHVVGDGVQTVEMLIARANDEERRRPGKNNELQKIKVDEETHDALERQGLALGNVPENRQTVLLKRIPAESNGGAFLDRTADIHPDNAEIARQAAMAVGLDLAGIDLIAPDITQSIWETGGGIAEVNSGPGLSSSRRATARLSASVAPAILRSLYPHDQPVRARIVAITGSHRPAQAAELIGHLLAAGGKTVGVATPSGVKIGNMRFRRQHPDDPNPTEIVLRNPTIDIAVLALDPADLDHPGLPFDCIDTAVINGAFAFTPQDGLHNIDTILARMVTPTGITILHADDLLTTDLATETTGSVLLISPTSGHPALHHHLDSGGRAIVITSDSAGPSLVARTGTAEQVILTPDQLSLFIEQINLDTLLFGIAVAISEGIRPDMIAKALQTFPATDQIVSQ